MHPLPTSNNTRETNAVTEDLEASAITFNITSIVAPFATNQDPESAQSAHPKRPEVEHHVFENGDWVATPSTTISAIHLPESALSHHVFVRGNWVRKPAPAHPAVNLVAYTDSSDYAYFGFQNHNPHAQNIRLQAIVDSGAQCCVWSWQECKAAGIKREQLIPVKQKLNAVSKDAIRIYGAVIIRVYGTPLVQSAGQPSCAAIVYVSPDVKGFYLSNDVMKQLLIVPLNFPCVGGAAEIDTLQDSVDEPCTCPKRTLPPGLPSKLPFAPVPENIPKMLEYLLNRYGPSTFNDCPHHLIPKIPGPPISIHVDPNATPVSCNVPVQVPLHYLDEVERMLKQDEAMGVISKVPHNVPTKWCHRMLVREKENSGKLRKVIDLSPLNKHTIREVHAMRSPFQLAKGVPAKTWRTVTDASNGYNSLSLREEDRPLTTFITHISKYWCNRAPQGFTSSGDGFNRRMDEILAEFPRHKRCVDDNLTYDEDLEQHWWRVMELLELMGKNGQL